MADTEKKRNNHYVPKMYLKQWSNNGNTVWTYDTIARSEHQDIWESKGVGGIAYWRDFYTQVGAEDTIDDSIENLFGDAYESKAGEALKKVRNDEGLDSEALAALVDFAILQMVRTPLWYMKVSLMTADLFFSASETTMERLEKELRLGLLTEKRARECAESVPDTSPFPQWEVGVSSDEVAKELKLSMTVGRKSYLASVGQILKGNVGNCMREYDWTIVKMPGDIVLPTCDNPFVRLCFRQDGRPSLDGAVAEIGAQLFMPLTPKHLLFTKVGGGTLESQHLVDDPWLAQLITGSIVQNALRYIYDRKKSDWIVKLRPRRVDSEYCNNMVKVMKCWNEIQD